MKHALKSLAAVAAFASLPTTLASATEPADQRRICEAALKANLADRLDGATLDYKSRNTAVRQRTFRFTVRHDGSWGVASCKILGEDIREVSWPRQFRAIMEAPVEASVEDTVDTAELTQ